MRKDRVKCSDKMIATALIAGMAAFMAISSAVPVIADELPDISEKVEAQETYTDTEDFGTVKLNSIDAPNKVFVGWNTKPDGSGIMYKAGDLLDIGKPITIYPVWEDVEIDFSVNGESETFKSGEDTALNTGKVKVDEEGLNLAPDIMGVEVNVNEGLKAEVEYVGVNVSKDVEASEDEMTIYPILENSADTVDVTANYEVRVIKDNKIIGKSDVAVPMTVKQVKNKAAEEEQEQTNMQEYMEQYEAETYGNVDYSNIPTE